MIAVTASQVDPNDPLKGLTVGERPEPAVPDGWTTVTVRATALNHHDLFTLRGIGISPDRLPMTLGAATRPGWTRPGNEVIVHAVIGEPVNGDETLDPRRTLLSELHQGPSPRRSWCPGGTWCPNRPG